MYLPPIVIHRPDTDFASYIAPLLDKDFDPFNSEISDDYSLGDDSDDNELFN